MQNVKVKVLDHPETFILIGEDRNPEQAKLKWLLKYHELNKPPTIGAARKRIKRHRTK